MNYFLRIVLNNGIYFIRSNMILKIFSKNLFHFEKEKEQLNALNSGLLLDYE